MHAQSDTVRPRRPSPRCFAAAPLALGAGGVRRRAGPGERPAGRLQRRRAARRAGLRRQAERRLGDRAGGEHAARRQPAPGSTRQAACSTARPRGEIANRSRRRRAVPPRPGRGRWRSSRDCVLADESAVRGRRSSPRRPRPHPRRRQRRRPRAPPAAPPGHDRRRHDARRHRRPDHARRRPARAGADRAATAAGRADGARRRADARGRHRRPRTATVDGDLRGADRARPTP